MVFRSFMPVSRSLARFDDPMSALRAVERGLGDLWQHFPANLTEAASLSVRLDVKEDEKAFYVTAELPGLTEKEVDVTFDDGILTVRGEKKIDRDEKKDTWHVTERVQGSFARQLSLPATIDAEKIEAAFDKGVLTVSLPKMAPEKAAAKKITIKAG